MLISSCRSKRILIFFCCCYKQRPSLQVRAIIIVSTASACIYRSRFQGFKEENKPTQKLSWSTYLTLENFLKGCKILFPILFIADKLLMSATEKTRTWMAQVSTNPILVLLKGPFTQPRVTTSSTQVQVKSLWKGHVVWEVSTLISKTRSCQPNLWESSIISDPGEQQTGTIWVPLPISQPKPQRWFLVDQSFRAWSTRKAKDIINSTEKRKYLQSFCSAKSALWKSSMGKFRPR